MSVVRTDQRETRPSAREISYSPAAPLTAYTVQGAIDQLPRTKADIGLGNVDNTSDVNKPVSTAQAAADAVVATNAANASNLTSGTVAIARGGTGQVTASTAFDALSPTTTRGDLISRGASSNARLPLGTSGYALMSNGTDPAWAAFLQSGTGAVSRTWNTKVSERVSVKDFGAAGDGTTNDTTAFSNAITYLSSTFGGGTLYVPPGTYSLIGGITIPSGVQVVGEGINVSTLQAWHTDVTVVNITGTHASIRDLSIYGKGTNADTGTLGATQDALIVGGVSNLISNVRVWGGRFPINATGTDSLFIDCDASAAYGNANVRTIGANWHIRGKYDHSQSGVSITTALPYPARANTTAYVVGNAVTLTGYTLVCSVAGTSAGSAPTVSNYGLPITDGTVTWLLAGPAAPFSAVSLAGGSAENHFYQCDMSGDAYSLSLSLNGTGAPAVGIFTDCCFSAPIQVNAGTWIGLFNCELGNSSVTVDTGFTGRFDMQNCAAVSGVANNVTIGANVNDFNISNNYLAGGTITTSGTSTRYVIAGNRNCTVADGATGAEKITTGPGVNGRTNVNNSLATWAIVGTSSVCLVGVIGTTAFLQSNQANAIIELQSTAGALTTQVRGGGFLGTSPSVGMGYRTGAGGTVSQATSRTTGVTINNVCGAITLFSQVNTAISQATAQSFTVTNSAVAATDVIICHQKSGTDKYEVFVTNVAAGSFQITNYTVSGTTNEAPVFNFVVIKGVTS